MSSIYYSLMGEGRGHAARARAMVERLRGRHRVTLFTSHDALEFLRREYAGDDEVQVHEVPGLRFHYTNRKIDIPKTIYEGLAFWAGVKRHKRELAEVFAADKPDLLVTDFEPLGPRAARRHGVPVLSLDHQHFMSTYDLSGLPVRLQRWAWAMSWSIWAFGIRQQRTVVSAFYKPPLRRGCEKVVQVGPLLRPAVRARTASNAGHVLSYCRKATPERVIEMLAASPLSVRLYGLGVQAPHGAITYCAIDEDEFLDDLASADCVVAAAGNQLLGEALHFGKPFFALPEYAHHEQCINACFLERLGGGEQRYLERVTAEDLAGFLARRETYRQNLADSDERFDGTEDAVAAIESMLSRNPA